MRKKLLVGLAVSGIISLLLILTRNSSPSLYLQGLVQQIFHAPKSALYDFTVSSSQGNELDKLKNENISLKEKLVELDNLEKDNTALRSQFEEGEIETHKLLPSKVIGFQGSIKNPDKIIIDKGLIDNLRAGQSVVIGKSLIGVVGDVSERYSTVILITDESFSTVAKTSQNSALGVVKGEGEFLLLDQIEITDSISENETIITRGTVDGSGIGIPPDLILGQVESVRKVESEPFQSAQVKSLVDTSKLTTVFVFVQ